MSKEIWNYYNNDSGRYLMKANFSDPEIINLEDDDEMGEMLADKVNEVESLKRKLELFDEAVKYLDQAARQWKMHVENFAQDDLETVLKEDHKNIEAQELSRCLQFLKKLGE